ncbi:unnamed protein product [Brassicogethes aeneus]|uniref:Uncharacterized protein n=1 Tax=Brassicogethes aeneus TaxID=1431903 RepID=A0A9P0BEF6_BRAAE|nr:unnamed protein product [Brassicogethes aeneus]
MPPNLEDNLSKSDNNITTHDIPNELGTPSTSSSASASDGASASGSTGPDNSLPSLHEYEEINLPDLDLPDLEGDLDLEYLNRFQIPLEQNLRELLVQVTNSDDLQSITQLKLKVIAREVPLQQLSIHTPFLRELILDGSIVSTLRDLGCGLKNLKILRVNRCMLTCIDSVFGFEMLEELYAADNDIKDLLPCAFLTNLKILDVRRNALKKTNTLGFLTLCPNLKDLYLEGNFESQVFPKYRETIKSMIPSLVALDGITFSEGNVYTKGEK